jgi:O-antigen ligase
MELSFKQRIFYFFPVLFCFCLPFGSLILSALIILWGITSFFNIDKKQLVHGFKNPALILLYLFFILTAISALFSENKNEALFNLELKLGFIFLPFYLFCFRWPVEVIKKCLVSFVSGCFFASLVLIVRACIYALSGHPEYFFYTYFSYFIHASYFAMYLILAVGIVVVYYPVWFKQHRQFLYVSLFFSIVFIVSVFLCASKLGIISFFICLPLLILNRFQKLFNLKKAFLLLVGLIFLAFFLAKIFPEPFERLNSLAAVNKESIDKTSAESTTVRILIWDQCITIIKNNLMGVGVGDVNDTLFAAYAQSGMTGALEHKLNAHNQFLQTFVGLGIVGFILLLLSTLGQIIVAILRRNFLFLLFTILIVLNFLVESMLQTSAGTLFFVFFLCLFNIPDIKNALRN